MLYAQLTRVQLKGWTQHMAFLRLSKYFIPSSMSYPHAYSQFWPGTGIQRSLSWFACIAHHQLSAVSFLPSHLYLTAAYIEVPSRRKVTYVVAASNSTFNNFANDGNLKVRVLGRNLGQDLLDRSCMVQWYAITCCADNRERPDGLV